MRALQGLTDLFIQHVADPKNVELWAEDGQLDCTQGLSIDGFDVAYTVKISMSDVDIQPHILMMHLINWLNRYDIGRANKGLPPPSFATQRLDNGKFDIALDVDIKESYSLIENPMGEWKSGDRLYSCISDFTSVVDCEELDTLKFVGGHENDLP